MQTPVPDQLTQDLHETNHRICLWLDSWSSSAEQARPGASMAAPQHIAGLLRELMRVGQWLRMLPEKRERALVEELSEYRNNVERLRALLPEVRSTLLRERARLERERARVESAAEWAGRSRQTL